MRQPSITFQEFALDTSQSEVNSILLTVYVEKKGQVNDFNEVFSLIQETFGKLETREQHYDNPTEQIYHAQDTERIKTSGFEALFLIMFEPQLTTDTFAIQVIINSKEAADTFWPKAAAWLRNTLKSWIASLKQSDVLLGYTLVYRANIFIEHVSSVSLLSSSVLSKLSSIMSNQAWERVSTIKTMLIPDQGLLYLVDVPYEENPALVYVALGIKGGAEDKDIASKSLAGQRGMLPNLDVFVHKSFTQWLSLEKHREQYEKRLKELNQHLSELLTAIGEPDPSKVDLKKIAVDFSILENFFWLIERMELSLQQSIHGIERLFQQEKLNEIAEVHLRGIRQKVEEIRYLINKSSLTIDTTRTALQMMEAQQHKFANEQRELTDDRQLKFSNFFVFLGIILTLMQVLDDKLVEELLKNEALLKQFTICTPSTYIKLTTRLISSLSLGGLIWIFVNKYIKLR